MKNSQHLRIFLTTSQICTVYATMLAKNSHQQNDVDILFIDGSKRKQGLIDLITKTSKIYPWTLLHDFSIPMGEDHDYNPTIGKNITRKFKNWPFIKSIYDFMLKKHMDRIDIHYRKELLLQLNPYLTKDTQISLYMLTQTYLNSPLMQLFPSASINYIEHGMGDYYYILDPKTPKGNFYCLFSEGYKKFLTKNGQSANWVKNLPDVNSFSEIAKQLNNDQENKSNVDYLKIPELPIVFILLEAVDMYNVKSAFWSDYLDHIFLQLEKPKQYHYLLKPHPMQSAESMVATTKHLDSLGYSYSILDESQLINTSAEVLFSIWEKQTRHVFCLFSSGCYYLSQLYTGTNIQYWYSTEFLSHYISNAPPQFKKMFVEIRPIIEEVLTEKCKSY